ncbi:PAS domain S-box protein [Methanofollis formosanus]|uniref:histidine kinase n=1 Tax=Methanofollis formosanus TaxID=299308 RepID=A0A8G1A1K0_9EURY|nr:PAS domain S-box protein [Methanofollis formosanus]QYZ79370.1 PAS domain S-box protein [Methanofollis formosanus]
MSWNDRWNIHGVCSPAVDFWTIFPIILTILSFGIVIFGFLNGVKGIIPVVLYLPIILIAYRQPNCGIQFSFLIGTSYLLIHLIYFPALTEVPVALIKATVLTGIGTLTSILSYRLNVKESNLRSIYDASAAGIFLLKRDGAIIEANSRLLSMLGYREDGELHHLDQIWEDERADELFESTTKDGKNQEIETVFRCRNKKSLPVLISAGPAPDERIVCTVVDISRIKTAEQKQQEERSRTRHYLDVAGVILLVIDDQMVVRMINRKGCSILGYPESEIIGKEWTGHFIPGHVKEKVKTACFTILSGSQISIKEFENPVLTRDGKERQISWDLRPLRDENGVIYSILASGEDVTQKKKTLEALKETEERYRRLITLTPEAIGIACQDKILYLNAAAQKVLRVTSLEAFEKRPFWSYIHPESREKVRNELQKIHTGVWSSYFNEIRLRLEDGTSPYIEATMIPITNQGYQAVQFVFRDITTEREMEEELRRSENLYRTLFEASGAATVIIEEDLTISLANSGFAELSGYAKNEIEGSVKWERFFNGAELDQMLVYHQKRCKESGDVPQVYTSRFVAKGGSVHDVIVTIALIPKTKKSVISLVDITVQKEYETKLKNSLKEKDVLLKEIHHRVKNNMQQIASLLSLQESFIKDADAIEQLKSCENRIIAMALVHENLYRSENLASIEAKTYISSLCSEIQNSYATGPGFAIEIGIDDFTLDIDTAIPVGLIVNELVSNAFKHAFLGRRTGTIRVGLQKKATNLCLTVEDDGIGFPPDIIEQNEGKLGIRLVKVLSEQIDGVLEVCTGKRTIFTIFFPYQSSDPKNE